MKRTLVLCLYNLLLPVVFLLAFPGWVLKMWKRGGFGSGLLERLGFFKAPLEVERLGGVYVHAVSVGEVMIALKLIRKWAELYPEDHFILVPTTATGHAVAKKAESNSLRVIYSPVDFGFIVRKVLNRFKPKQVVLIEAEMWPNLLNICRKKGIPVSVANTRLSKRSERRYNKVLGLVSPIFQMVDTLAVQERQDIDRWVKLGVGVSNIKHTGSVKFDFTGGELPQKRKTFSEMLDNALGDSKVVMAISTFPGEEAAIARSLKGMERVSLVFVPRHAERREEVVGDLVSEGFAPILRSNQMVNGSGEACFVIDSTGELRDWTAHADIVIVGKSWLAKGGQNPTEAVAAMVPVIVGPRMDNFEPLVSSMVAEKGVTQLSGFEELKNAVEHTLSNPEGAVRQTERAREVLKAHDGATARTVRALRNQ